MELQPNKNGQTLNPPDPLNSSTHEPFLDDIDSTCSTPYVSAPSSPGRSNGPINGGFFYSCPASPMHFAITATTSQYSLSAVSSPDHAHVPIGYEFEFSSRLGGASSSSALLHDGSSMSSADELFLNGQIRPMKLSSHLERPQVLAPLLDLENEEDDDDDNETHDNLEREKSSRMFKRGRDVNKLRDKSLRRRSRSLSPFRSSPYEFDDEDINGNSQIYKSSVINEEISENGDGIIKNIEEGVSGSSTTSVSASSSRSSSAGRNSKRWVFLKDFLYRSKSEGRSTNKFWSNISFSPAKEKNKSINTNTNTPSSSSSSTNVQMGSSKEKGSNVNVHAEAQKGKGNGQNYTANKKPMNGVGKRKVTTSPHELHYKASKAQAEEMRKKTFLPYRQGLLGCLGFSSKGYGAMNGFARALNPVSSR